MKLKRPSYFIFITLNSSKNSFYLKKKKNVAFNNIMINRMDV